MPTEVVLDASVAAKIFFTEDGSDRARSLATSGRRFCAPEFISLEIASVGTKYVRRGDITLDHAQAALASLVELVDEMTPVSGLATRAQQLAILHGFSVYDATYVALAEQRGLSVITADQKLVDRAVKAGVGHLLEAL